MISGFRYCIRTFKTVASMVTWALALSAVASTAQQPRSSGGRWGPGLGFPPDENPQFFPTEAFGSNRAILARCYSWYLRSMEEPPLPNLVDEEHPQVYRAVVLPPYSSPVVVRLSVEVDGTGDLETKIGQSDLKPSPLAMSRTARIPEAEITTWMRLLTEANFWSMPTQQIFDRNTGMLAPAVMGDTSWMLEGTKGGRYHLVHRGGHQLGALKDPLIMLVINLARVDLRSLPTQPITK